MQTLKKTQTPTDNTKIYKENIKEMVRVKKIKRRENMKIGYKRKKIRNRLMSMIVLINGPTSRFVQLTLMCIIGKKAIFSR